MPAAAARVADLAAAIAVPGWEHEARALAGSAAGDAPGRRPTYGEVARAGTALVRALAARGRWEEAEAQAVHMHRVLTDPRAGFPPLARVPFGGLVSAARARDPDELADVADLLDELMGAG